MGLLNLKTKYYKYRLSDTNKQRFIRSTSLRLLTFLFITANLLTAILPPLLTNPPAKADNPYLASDVLGQTDSNGDADFTTQDLHNGSVLSGKQEGYSYPYDVKLDAIHHRLFVLDTNNNRVLIYNLNASNQLTDKDPDFVLGQPDFATYDEDTTAQGFKSPRGLAYDPVQDRLFVVDTYNNRVLVFNTATIINNEDAVNVLGQADFTSSGYDVNAKGFFVDPHTAAYDAVNNRLFVADTRSGRILVFDTTTITDNEDAVNVLGQANFTGGGEDTNAKGFTYPMGMVYDTANNRLFVAESGNNRVLVFDTATITNNEDAVNVLGQSDFTGGIGDTTAKGFSYPRGLAYDPIRNYLFVAEESNDRVLVFDTTTITNNEDAINVLGQPDFTTFACCDDANAKGFTNPWGLEYDTSNKLLYSVDQSNNRLLIFDTTTITNNEDAVSVMGQTDADGNPSFTTSDNNNGNGSILASNDGFRYPQGTTVDTVHHRLFVGDCGWRLLVFNLNNNNNLTDRTADYVLGQPDFQTEDGGTTQNDTTCVVGPSYDPNHDRVFVTDYDRVLVYDLSGGITNGMNASYVLGQPDFTTDDCGTTQAKMCGSYGGSAYDPATDYYYLTDSDNARVLVWDLSSGITNGMNASYVLGQPDFTTNNATYPEQNSLEYPYGLALDTENNRLFIADWGVGRVLVFDTSNLSNGMNASYVLGQPDFTSTEDDETLDASHFGPTGLAYDPEQQYLFVEDDNFARVMIFDVNSITNGENATGVLGAPDLTTDGYNYDTSQSSLNDPEGLSDFYDTTTNRLYVSDSSNRRVMIFDFAKLVDAPAATTGSAYSQNLGSQTQGTTFYTLDSGSLPPGLVLNPATGALAGVPTTPGTYNFTVTLSDDNDTAGTFTDTKAYVLAVSTTSSGGSGSGSTGSSSSGSTTTKKKTTQATTTPSTTDETTEETTPEETTVTEDDTTDNNDFNTTNDEDETTPPETKESSGLPWWAWGGIGLALIALIIFIIKLLGGGGNAGSGMTGFDDSFKDNPPPTINPTQSPISPTSAPITPSTPPTTPTTPPAPASFTQPTFSPSVQPVQPSPTPAFNPTTQHIDSIKPLGST